MMAKNNRMAFTLRRAFMPPLLLLANVLPSTLHVVKATADIDKFYTDLNDTENPNWYKLRSKLVVGKETLGPALGSTIKINRDETEIGEYGKRTFTEQRVIHTPTACAIFPGGFGNMTRWYQEDGNTQIFRMFPHEDNIRSNRTGAPRVEAYSKESWKRGDGWHEWSGRYTFLKARRGSIFQLKHNVSYWSMQLILSDAKNSTLDLEYVRLRPKNERIPLVMDVIGKGIDIRVLDDGDNHMVYVDGALMIESNYTDRRDDEYNHARWGPYLAPRPVDRDILIFVTGAQIQKVGSSKDKPEKGTGPGHSLCVPDEENEEGDFDRDYTNVPEPDPEFLARWYGNPANDGYGFF